MRRKDTGRRRGRRPKSAPVRKKVVKTPATTPSDWPPLIFDNPYAGEEYTPDAEPSLRDVLREASKAQWPPPRLPERRYRDLERMLSITSPSRAFRGRLYEILRTVVSCDERVNPRQRDARTQNEARERERARRFAAIEKAARELHRLLIANDGDAYQQRQDETALGAVADYAATVAFVAERARWARSGRGHRRQGRPKDELGRWLIRHLGDLYTQATGKAPVRTTDWDTGVPGGPFFDFVRYVYDWLGPPYWGTKDHALARQIREYDIRRYDGGSRPVRHWGPFELAMLAAERAPARKG